MCGILLSLMTKYLDLSDLKEISKDQEEIGEIEMNQNNNNENLNILEDNFDFSSLFQNIKNRGPDYSSIINYSYNDESFKYNQNEENFKINHEENSDLNFNHIVFFSSILSLRGVEKNTKQPFLDNFTGNVLLYNGEIYGFNSIQLNHLNFIKFDDFDLLKINDGLQLFSIQNQISLYFKDKFGSLNEKSNETYAEVNFELFNKLESDHALCYFDRVNKKLLLSRDIFGKRSLLLIYSKIKKQLLISSVISKEIYCQRHLFEIVEVPANKLIIFDFQKEEQSLNPISIHSNPLLEYPSLIRFPKTLNLTKEKIEKTELKELNEEQIYLAKECYKKIRKSVEKRILNLPDLASQNENSDTSIGILFSGGIDSLLLTYTVAEVLPNNIPISIDLINISFSKDAPDRVTGLIGYYELLKLFPNKKINLILVDKSYENDIISLQENIKFLIYPKETHMDFNISTALKLASMKKGKKINKEKFISFMDTYIEKLNKKLEEKPIKNQETNNYCNEIISKKLETIDYSEFLEVDEFQSTSKILISGLGADEFFGGYARYKNQFLIDGLLGLSNEMTKDINRIWTRNFGRDDRACSDNGIELRFPYFDMELINFLSSIDQTQITNFNMNRGIGEKILLRNLVKVLGFKICSLFEKRAIQFGTRLAKETNIKTYGSNRKANGKAQFK